jgi:hypothetical protein
MSPWIAILSAVSNANFRRENWGYSLHALDEKIASSSPERGCSPH